MRNAPNHSERLAMILAGEKPDRFAGSFWRHFFDREVSARGTTEAMLDFQSEFDWDFMKINPRADYHVQDFGLQLKYSTNEHVKHQKLSFPINSIDDWARLSPLPATAPALDEHLLVVARLRRALGPDLPLLMTVFTPLSLAGRMVPEREILREHLRSDPDKVLPGLEAITQTFETYAAELRGAGADGLFFATTQWASSDMLTWAEYQKYGVPFDQRVIEATENSAINILHICGGNNYLAQMAELDYNCSMYSWDALDPTNLSLQEGLDLLGDRIAVGGFPWDDSLVNEDEGQIIKRLDQLKDSFSPDRLIIAPGCAIPTQTPKNNLAAIRTGLC